MRRPLIAASLTLAVLFSAAGTAAQPLVEHHYRGCHKRFTDAMVHRAASLTTPGLHDPTHAQLRRLGWYERCAWHPARVRAHDHALLAANRRRRAEAQVAAYDPTPYGEWAIPGYIVTCESGGTDEPVGADGNPTTASGYYQMEDPTWQEWASAAGLRDFPPEAWEASKRDQDIAANYGYTHDGAGPWVCG